VCRRHSRTEVYLKYIQKVRAMQLDVQAVPVLIMPMQRTSIGFDRLRVRGSTCVWLKHSGKRTSSGRLLSSSIFYRFACALKIRIYQVLRSKGAGTKGLWSAIVLKRGGRTEISCRKGNESRTRKHVQRIYREFRVALSSISSHE
jgi:hypothetical protein